MSLRTSLQSTDSSSSYNNEFSPSTSAIRQPVRSRFWRRLHEISHMLISYNVDPTGIDENIRLPDSRAKFALRAFFLYMLFVSNVLIVFISSQSPHNFLVANAFEYHLIAARFPVKAAWLERDAQLNPNKSAQNKYGNAFMINFTQIATFSDIWQFMNVTVGNVYYRSHVWKSNPAVTVKRSVRWVLDHSLMMGVIRMRQVRVKAEKCNTPKSYYDEIADCYPAYSSAKKDTESFGPIAAPRHFSGNTEVNMKHAWRYMSANATGARTFTGQYGTYDGSGYVADLAQYDRTNKRFIGDLNELEKHAWLDKATRALFIDIVTYNPSVNLFCHVKLTFEMPATGGIFPSYKIENKQLLRYVTPFEFVRIGCEVVIITFTIAFFFVEIAKIIHLRFTLFLNIWNWIDIILLVISVLIIYANIHRLLTVNSAVGTRMSIYISTFDDLTMKLLDVQSLFDTLSVLLTSISVIRILKYCDFVATLIRIKATIQRCYGDLIGFLIMFLAIMVAYAQFGNLALGQRAPAFSTVGRAFVALFRTVLGDFDYEAIRDASPIIGPLFFILYIFSMVFMLFNMVLAIIVDSYEELGSEHRDVINRMLIDVRPFIKHSIQTFFERIGLWTQVKSIVHFVISAEDPADTKTVGDLLQQFKYSAASSSLYEELRRAFAHDNTRVMSKQDFDIFLKYARDDRDRQRDTLQSLFAGNVPLANLVEEQDWHWRARSFCTLQQWAHLRYRIARLEELLDLIESKIDYVVYTSDALLGATESL